MMYHHLATSKETLKKDYAVLERKYKRKADKFKQLDVELKFTREQVAEFKKRFRTLSGYIQMKGGIEHLNKLPDIGGRQDQQDT